MGADHRFAAMGTDAHVIVVGLPSLTEWVQNRIEDLEARWSRFRPTSEVSRLNAAGGEPLEVSEDTRTLVERAVETWRLTGGFADCTLLDQVMVAGYDRSFGDLPASRTADPAPAPISLLGPGDIEISGSTVRLPAGIGFDPGGIGKGLAADLVADEVIRLGADGVCINLGGDVRVRGTGPDGGTWTISIDYPSVPAPIARLGLADGGVASSTTLRRRWTVAGEERHHLIDPRTGQPSTSELAFVTVVAGEAWVAEGLAKGVLLRGGVHPFDLMGGTGADALVVDHEGRITASSGLAAYLGDQVLPDHLPSGALEVAS